MWVFFRFQITSQICFWRTKIDVKCFVCFSIWVFAHLPFGLSPCSIKYQRAEMRVFCLENHSLIKHTLLKAPWPFAISIFTTSWIFNKFHLHFAKKNQNSRVRCWIIPWYPFSPQWRLRNHHTRSARRGECCVPWCRHKFSVILFSFNKGTSFPLFSLLWTNCPVQSLQHVLWLHHPGDYRNTQSYFLRQVFSTSRQEWLEAIGFAAGGRVICRRRRKKWFTFRIIEPHCRLLPVLLQKHK